MKIGNYQVKLNYGLLKGFIDVMGLLLAYLIYQTTFAFASNLISPSSTVLKRIIEAVYPDGIPLQVWLAGFSFPAVALGVVIFSVYFMFKAHKEPKRFIITEQNAQKYYDTIAITNGLIRIVMLLGLWDLTYICQNNLLFQGTSWFSFQTVLDILVIGLIVYVTYCRVKSFAKQRTAEDVKAEKVTSTEDGKVKIKNKEDSDDIIMRG
ncbi:MAG: hypothetical protein IKT78_00135 [Ruminiclostridium sp.]|nr:hypothetical protein [Ruminiclostridium sp.]